jgi:hypothetical protein
MRARSPAIDAAIEVIGATVVAIRGRLSPVSVVFVSVFDEQAANKRTAVAARMPDLIFVICPVYDLSSLLQTIRNKGV